MQRGVAMYENAGIEMLMKRVERLEKQNCRWKVAGIFFTVSGISIALMGGAKTANSAQGAMVRAGTVEARDFILKDADGRVRARLTLDPGKKDIDNDGEGYRLLSPQKSPGQPALQFYDSNGNVIDTTPAHAGYLQTK